MPGPRPSLSISRRGLFGLSAAAVGAAMLPQVAQAAPRGAAGGALLREFAEPGPASAAGLRWWWPHGLVDPGEIAREVDQVADAGFGTLEITDVTHSLSARRIGIDVRSHGWGTAPWVAGVEAALRRASERGLTVDIAVGPSWPAAVPTITPDSDAACTELAHGRVSVAAGTTYDDVVPEPVVPAHAGSTRRTLVAVQAGRVTGTDRNGTAMVQDSLLDLTASVTDGRLRWTAPAEGTWVLLSYWRRGSAQEPEAGPHTEPRSYVVDHFSAAGSQAVIDVWEDLVLTPTVRDLLRTAGGNLFEDSLEIETDATIWTPRMLEEFRARAGYDLLPYLPVVIEQNEKYLFVYDPVTTNRVRDDFNQVLSDLYRDNHLLALQRWARGLGLGLRVQPYGLETDAIEHSALVDVPETESLGFKNLDDYRVMAGGRDMAGKTVLSCEAACYNGAAYSTTWDRALQTINSVFAGGVNRAMLHGFAYADVPGVTWPGFAAFSPYYNGAIGFGEAWGPRTPTWQHVPDIAGYLARTQLVLQSGTPRYDIVFLRQKGWASTGIGAAWATNEGIPRGWTHSFLTPALLDLPSAVVRDGRLAPDGPAYKAVIVGPDQFRGKERTVAVATARRLLSLARQGLRVVLHGDWSAPQPVGLPQPGETAELQGLVDAIRSLPTTASALNDGDIPTALAALGVVPDVVKDPTTVMTVRRVLPDADLYYVVNAKHAENRRLNRVQQDLWLTATDPTAVPWSMDAWTGEVTPIAVFDRDGDRVRVSVDLRPGQSTVVALAAPGWAPGRSGLHATASEAEVRSGTGSLFLRAAQAGTFATTLSDGRVVRTKIGAVPAPVALTSWELEVEDWQPGATATQTVKPVRRLSLSALAPWSSVPGLEDVSGIGRYRTTVVLGEEWTAEHGALLELGEVNDTFRVTVNDRLLPPADVLDTTVDVGRSLHPGANTITVEVATTLFNRLRTVTPEVYAVGSRQAYGLVGPVRLVPYAEQRVR